MKYYETTDTAFAAYLCHNGYTLLGAVQTPGSPRVALWLTWADMKPTPQARALGAQTIEDMHRDVLRLRELFDTEILGYKRFLEHYRMCLRKIKNPEIKEAEWKL